jgi:alpha,alpha-trehalase
MLANFASLVDRFGFIPNSNRGYMFSRSQPPFFHKMVELLAGPEDPVPAFQRYLPQLRREYAYWMAGADGLPAGSAQAHVARLPDGSLLNRYWDTLEQPRPESFREDVLTARRASGPAARVYRDLRAGAESGWDFSSRWCADPDRIETIQTTSILPVDLNALLWGLEQALAQGCAQAGAAAEAAAFADAALRRRDAIERFMWSTPQGHYVDYHWPSATPGTQLTAAALVPLFAGLATRTRAAASAQALVTGGLLAPNGLLTTTHRSGQQWDAPNGWAPLQWMAVQGLARYGHEALARDIAARWVGMVQRVFRRTGLLLEKYDVTQDQPGGGGEYETQDGFGWTNGTYRALQEWIRLTAPPTKSA